LSIRRIKLTLQYDGTAYNGWQVQPTGITVQGLLEEGIGRITGERVQVVGAGRTDTGVHALGQVASFDSSSSLDIPVIKRGVNALLPADLRILEASETAADFHPRYGALRKRYFYLIANCEVLPVFIGRYVWWIRNPLDLEGMRRAAGFMRGSRDFSSFRGAGCGAKSPVREVYSIETEMLEGMEMFFTRISGSFIRISIEANGFLRHMVRNIVGTFVEVGTGRKNPEAVGEILEARDRRLAGPTAPAKGLFLEKIFYASS